MDIAGRAAASRRSLPMACRAAVFSSRSLNSSWILGAASDAAQQVASRIANPNIDEPVSALAARYGAGPARELIFRSSFSRASLQRHRNHLLVQYGKVGWLDKCVCAYHPGPSFGPGTPFGPAQGEIAKRSHGL